MGLMRVVNLAHGAFCDDPRYAASVLIAAGLPFVPVAALRSSASRSARWRKLTIYRPLYRRASCPSRS
jgi:branched-subunit amino acid ABC-type transport system permease component